MTAVRWRDIKLTPPQARVMKWVGKKWTAYKINGATVEINGQKVCNIDTMATLERHGLVTRKDEGSGVWSWDRTDKGREMAEELWP